MCVWCYSASLEIQLLPILVIRLQQRDVDGIVAVTERASTHINSFLQFLDVESNDLISMKCVVPQILSLVPLDLEVYGLLLEDNLHVVFGHLTNIIQQNEDPNTAS